MMQSFEILDAVATRQWEKHNRPFESSAALERAVKREFTKQGIPAIRAQYDRNGDCIICGECGRCPGYHTPTEVKQAGCKDCACAKKATRQTEDDWQLSHWIATKSERAFGC